MVLVDAIFSLVYAALSVQGNVVQNRRKAKSLAVCLEAIMPPLRTIEDSENTIAHVKTLEALKEVVVDAKTLLEKQCTRSSVSKLVSSSSVKWQFADITQRLQSHMQALNLSVGVLQRMDSKKRDADDAADFDEMQGEIRKMLQGNQSELQAQLAELDAGQQAKAQEMILKLTEGHQQLREDISRDFKDIIKDMSHVQQADSSLPHIDMATDLKSTGGVDTLGAGGFGEVRKMVWATGGDIEVAVKVLLARKPSPKALLELRKEAEAMHAMRHPNVIQLYGASLKPPHLCLVLEFAPYGSLEDALREEGAPEHTAVWRERLLIASDIMKGLKYLHSRKVLHLDIKSGNVMLFDHQSRRLAKLADFGLAFIKNETSAAGSVAVKTNAGTVNWKPPELFRKGGEATRASDVYSCACVMYELASGSIPWYGEGPGDIIGHVALGERPDKPVGCIEPLWKLIAQGWAQNPKHRVTVDTALKQLEALVNENNGGNSRPLALSKPVPLPKPEPMGTPELDPQLAPQPNLQVKSSTYPTSVTTQPNEISIVTVPANAQDHETAGFQHKTVDSSTMNTGGELFTGVGFRVFAGLHAILELINLVVAAEVSGVYGNVQPYASWVGATAFGSCVMMLSSANIAVRIALYPEELGFERMQKNAAAVLSCLAFIFIIFNIGYVDLSGAYQGHCDECAGSSCSYNSENCDGNYDAAVALGAVCIIFRIFVFGAVLLSSYGKVTDVHRARWQAVVDARAEERARMRI